MRECVNVCTLAWVGSILFMWPRRHILVLPSLAEIKAIAEQKGRGEVLCTVGSRGPFVNIKLKILMISDTFQLLTRLKSYEKYLPPSLLWLWCPAISCSKCPVQMLVKQSANHLCIFIAADHQNLPNRSEIRNNPFSCD